MYTCIKLRSAFQNFSITPEPEIKQVPINLDSDVITLWDVTFYISCKNYSTCYLLVTHIVEIIKVIIVVLQVCKQVGKLSLKSNLLSLRKQPKNVKVIVVVHFVFALQDDFITAYF